MNKLWDDLKDNMKESENFVPGLPKQVLWIAAKLLANATIFFSLGIRP